MCGACNRRSVPPPERGGRQASAGVRRADLADQAGNSYPVKPVRLHPSARLGRFLHYICMKQKTHRRFVLIGLPVLALVACSSVTQLVLDDSWALEEIRGGEVITTNLDDYLTVDFDAGNDTATVTIGPDWDSLSGVDVSGTFDFAIDAGEQTIALSRGGDIRHEIVYEFDDALRQMRWTRWTVVSPDVTVVSEDSTIRSILFERTP